MRIFGTGLSPLLFCWSMKLLKSQMFPSGFGRDQNRVKKKKGGTNTGLAFNRWTQRILHLNANVANEAASQTRSSRYLNIAAEEIPPLLTLLNKAACNVFYHGVGVILVMCNLALGLIQLVYFTVTWRHLCAQHLSPRHISPLGQ